MFNYFSFGQLDSVHGLFGTPRNRFSTMTRQACFETTCNLCYRPLAKKMCLKSQSSCSRFFQNIKRIFIQKDIRKKHHQRFGHYLVNCIYIKILIYQTVIILLSLFVVCAQRSGDYTKFNVSLGAVRSATQFQNRMQRKAN